MPNIIEVTSVEQFQQALENTKGSAVLEFKAEWCPHCKDEEPAVRELAEKCPTTTVFQVDVDRVPELADAWNVEGMPTLYVANKAADLKPGKAKEVEGAEAAAKKLKCSR